MGRGLASTGYVCGLPAPCQTSWRPGQAWVSPPEMSCVETGLGGNRTSRIPTRGSRFLEAETRDPVKGVRFLLHIRDPTLTGTTGGRPAANCSGRRRADHGPRARPHQRRHEPSKTSRRLQGAGLICSCKSIRSGRARRGWGSAGLRICRRN